MTKTNSEVTADVLAGANTAWDELSIAGKELQEASSTSLPPSYRFLFIRDGDPLTPAERDSQVTHDPPVFRITVADGETWVVRGSERNAYLPGTDTAAGVAWRVADTGPDGQYLPSGVVVEDGYASLVDTLDGAFPIPLSPTKEGFVTRYTADSIEGRIYKNDSAVTAATTPLAEWDTNPFADAEYQAALDEWIVRRRDFDLYGAGECENFLRLRTTRDEAETLPIYTLGLKADPVLRDYNLPNSIRIENTSGAPKDIEIGPLHFYNKTDATPPGRRTDPEYRSDLGLTAGIDSGSWDVLTVYRLRLPGVGVRIEDVDLETGGATRLLITEVHPEYLSFLAGFAEDEAFDTYGDWHAPGLIDASETALQEADIVPGDVTLSTYADVDGKTKPRGRIHAEVGTAAAGGNRTSQAGAAVQETLGEYSYAAIIGQGATPDRLQPKFEERW